MAQDIRDLCGSSGQDGPSDSLLNKKKLLPIVHALESGEPRSQGESSAPCTSSVSWTRKTSTVWVEILEEASAMEFSRKLLASHCERAVDALSRNTRLQRGDGRPLERLLQEMMDEA